MRFSVFLPLKLQSWLVRNYFKNGFDVLEVVKKNLTQHKDALRFMDCAVLVCIRYVAHHRQASAVQFHGT